MTNAHTETTNFDIMKMIEKVLKLSALIYTPILAGCVVYRIIVALGWIAG